MALEDKPIKLEAETLPDPVPKVEKENPAPDIIKVWLFSNVYDYQVGAKSSRHESECSYTGGGEWAVIAAVQVWSESNTVY